MGRGAKAYAPSDVPVKGTNVRTQFRQQSPKGNRPGPVVSDCRAYSIRPYPDGRKNRIIFLTHMFSQSLFFVRMGRAQKHTPLQTFPSRERMQIAGLANNHRKATARALSFPIVGRMQYAPTLTVEKT